MLLINPSSLSADMVLRQLILTLNPNCSLLLHKCVSQLEADMLQMMSNVMDVSTFLSFKCW